MEKKSMIVAALFVISTLVFFFQSFDQFGGGNWIAGVVNIVATVFVGRIAWERVQKVLSNRI
jgi:hypothetical protein